jgi:hypothetical protein
MLTPAARRPPSLPPLPAAPADPDLTEWETQPFTPFLPAPAFDGTAPAPAPVDAARIAARDAGTLGAAAGLTGWRDPFVVARPTPEDPHFYVIVGAGERRAAGTVLLYRSRSIHEGARERGACGKAPRGAGTLCFAWFSNCPQC